MRIFVFLIALAGLLAAEIIDRVAISVGNQAITELQIDEEVSVTALLNHQPVPRDVQSRRRAAERLLQQFLIRREMEVSRYPGPTPTEIDTYVERVETDLGGAAGLPDLLKTYGIDKTTLKDHLALQLATLDFIEFRFRPQPVANNDTGRHTDDPLNVWLKETRKRFEIIYLDKTLE